MSTVAWTDLDAAEPADLTSVAVLDDYQRVAARMADWSGRLPNARVRFLHEHAPDEDALVAALEGFGTVVAMRERTPFPRRVLERLPELRLLVTTGMRNASIDLVAARALGITVTGTRANQWSTAELAWALILGLVRGTAADDAAIRAGRWQESVGQDLGGRTLGIVGLGRLGARVARIGQAFDMRVVAWSPHLTAARAAEHGVEAVPTKRELFAEADVATLHMVLADSTRGLVAEPELRALGEHSFLVNTSRAALVDQAALARALTEGWIAGAGLDVFETEPLPAEHWLRTSPRTLLTPHMGYVSEKGYRIFYEDAVEDIAGFLKGAVIRPL